MGTRDLTHKAIAEALSNDRLLTHDQRAALLTLVADDSVWQRKCDKAQAEVALLRAALNGGNVIERLQFALQRLADAADGVGVKHFDTDWLSDEVQELQAATHAARLVLGHNVRVDLETTR
jgi:hypothetical protein